MDWKPKAPIMVDSAEREPTKPSKPGFVGFEGAISDESAKILERLAKAGTFPLSGPPGDCARDPYRDRLRAVLQQTCQPDYPEGVILWLEKANPELYRDITSRSPDLIDWLWIARAPLEIFERALSEWLAAHRRACSLFKRRAR